MKLFRNLGIVYKLAAILGLVLLGFVVVGFAYKFVLDRNAEAENEIARLADFEREVAKARVDLFHGRAIEEGFFLDHDIAAVQQFEDQMTAARRSLSRIDEMAPEGMNRAEIADLQRLFREYHAGFYTAAEALMAVGIDANSGLLGELTEAAAAIESELSAAKDVQLQLSMAIMRRYEKAYLADKSEKSIEEMHAELSRFNDALLRSTTSDEFKRRVRGLMDRKKRVMKRPLSRTSAAR